MSLFDWLKPGIRVKRWLLMGMLGLAVFVLGISKILLRGPILDRYLVLYLYISLLGGLIIYAAIRLSFKSVLSLLSGTSMNSSINAQVLTDLLYEQRLLIRGPRIVAIGGGTGLSTMIRGLKAYTSNITAVVTVADDGGGSGKLRGDLGILPPGDIRNCLVALAHTEPIMEELMQYRFTEGSLKGQNFGNLFLAAMNGISSSFEEGIKKMSDVLAVQGKVYPVTLEDVTLCASLENGMVIKGESNIPIESFNTQSGIKKVFLEPSSPEPFENSLFAIENADCIIMGPGSLYTSVLPNLIIERISESIKNSKALKIYVSNIMTQPGETDGYKLSNHINAILDHCGEGLFDFAIANDGIIPEEYFIKYKNDGQDMVEIDKDNIPESIEIITEDLVQIKNGLLRHDTERLAIVIMKLILKYVMPINKRRIFDYYYLSERIKEKR